MAAYTADCGGATVNEWVNIVRRARLTKTTKYIALLLATYADADGSGIYPGVARLAVQSDYSYRTIQIELARLRAMGLIQKLPRKGKPRHFSDGYRLTLGPDVLEKADVPVPAAEDAEIAKVRRQYQGRHRAKSARNPDCVQLRDCTQSGLRADRSVCTQSKTSLTCANCSHPPYIDNPPARTNPPSPRDCTQSRPHRSPDGF